MNSFVLKLTIFTILVLHLRADCHIGEYLQNSTCQMCQRLTPNCISCNQTSGVCNTCKIILQSVFQGKGNIPAWVDSKTNITTCTCPSQQVIGFNIWTQTIGCQSNDIGQLLYYNNTAQLKAMTNNLTLSNLYLITGIIWGCQSEPFGTDYTILTQMMNILLNGSQILTGSISQGGSPQNTQQAILALIGKLFQYQNNNNLGIALNPTQSLYILESAASMMYDLLQSSTTNIVGIDYGLEFYSIAMSTVSSPTFFYEISTTSIKKGFLQMLETNQNNIISSLLSNIYFILPSGQPYMSSYTSIESTIVKLNTTGSQSYQIFENQFGITISQAALSLLPQDDIFLYISVQYQNPFAYYPNITYSVQSKLFNVLFFDSNFNLLNAALTGLNNVSYINMILSLNSMTQSIAQLVYWDTDVENWQQSQICSQQLNTSSVVCSPTSLSQTMYSLIIQSTLVTSCNTGEILSSIQNKCLLCNDLIPGCLQCSGFSCNICAGLVPGSTYSQGSCICQNENMLVYNVTTLQYVCASPSLVMSQYNAINLQNFSGILSSNQMIDLIGAAYIGNITVINNTIIPIFTNGINYTNTYMRSYYLQFCINVMLQPFSSYSIVSTLMNVVNLLKSMQGITNQQLQMIGEFYGLALGQVTSLMFYTEGITSQKQKYFLNQLHVNINNFKISLAMTNQSATYHFSNLYMGVTQIQAINNSFSSSLKGGSHSIQLGTNALSKLPTSTNYLVHQVLDIFSFQNYPNISIPSIVSPYSVLFLDESYKTLNNGLFNLSRSLQLNFVDYYFDSNQTLLSWDEIKLQWKFNTGVCSSSQSNNMLPLISCFPDSIVNFLYFNNNLKASAQLFVIEAS